MGALCTQITATVASAATYVYAYWAYVCTPYNPYSTYRHGARHASERTASRHHQLHLRRRTRHRTASLRICPRAALWHRRKMSDQIKTMHLRTGLHSGYYLKERDTRSDQDHASTYRAALWLLLQSKGYQVTHAVWHASAVPVDGRVPLVIIVCLPKIKHIVSTTRVA